MEPHVLSLLVCFFVPNFRPLKRAAGASVQHCADGSVIKTWVSCRESEIERVVNRWAHCFLLAKQGLVGAWEGEPTVDTTTLAN